MKKILSLGVIARIAIFVVVVAVVMSVSFLVQAHDAPTPAVAAEAPAVKIEPIVSEIDLSDVPDGYASWYGSDFHGRRTASGARYDMNEFTAAHKSLPFGTIVRVMNEKTGKACLVEITDRGPFVHRRVVDLSRAAAQFIDVSVTPVAVDALRKDDVERFYENNDSTCIVFSDEFKPLSVRKQAITIMGQSGSLTSIMRTLESGERVLVACNENGKIEYSRAKVASSL